MPMHAPPITTAQRQLIDELRAKRMTRDEIANELGLTYWQVRRHLAKQTKKASLERQKAERDMVREARAVGGVDPELDIWGEFERLQQLYNRPGREKTAATIRLKESLPVLFIYSTDWHIGHQYCDMPKLRQDLTIAGEIPGIYLGSGGDLFENVITTAPVGSQFEQLAPPRIQKLLVEQALSWVKGKVKAVLLGNHDARSITDDDFDPCAWFAYKIGAPYLGYWGLLQVKLGKQTYRLLLGHQFRMSSYFNRTHSAKRMMECLADADVVMLGHRHDMAAEMTRVRQDMRFFAQGGTYLRYSRYAQSKGFSLGSAEMPGVILFPDEHKILGVHDAFGVGIHILASYRPDVKCPCIYCQG